MTYNQVFMAVTSYIKHSEAIISFPPCLAQWFNMNYLDVTSSVWLTWLNEVSMNWGRCMCKFFPTDEMPWSPFIKQTVTEFHCPGVSMVNKTDMGSLTPRSPWGEGRPQNKDTMMHCNKLKDVCVCILGGRDILDVILVLSRNNKGLTPLLSNCSSFSVFLN